MSDVIQICVPLLIVLLIAPVGQRVCTPLRGEEVHGRPNIEEMCRRPSDYVDRILRGTKPGELSIQRPHKFDFALNMRTAKALRLTIPQSVLTRVEQVIR